MKTPAERPWVLMQSFSLKGMSQQGSIGAYGCHGGGGGGGWHAQDPPLIPQTVPGAQRDGASAAWHMKGHF